MAGDVGIEEAVVVVPAEAEDVAAAAVPEVAEVAGRVSHQYGPRVLVIEATSEEVETVAAQVPEGAVAAEPAEVAKDLVADLDDEGALGFTAFALRSSEDYASAKAQRPLAEESWDTDAASAPDYFDEAEAAASDAMAPGPSSARLTGSVAVGIIIVEGPTAALKFSSAERVKVVAEVQNGLSWLGAQSSPEGVRFVYDINVVTLTTKPGDDSLSFGEKEARWRDPAMKKLGYGAGMAGVTDYVQDIRSAKATKWAYCAFFTKYPVGWFAYASIGGPRLVMDYANAGWGPDNIDRVFAHETGHIFGAPDEYASSNCKCGGSWGYFNRPNGNCANCASGGGVDCIMRSNSWTMCAWTPFHLGFAQGLRYSGVFNTGSGGYGLWVNASWPYFVKKWQDWAKAGLRLEDLEITRIGGKTLYSGVWRQGSGGYGLWVNATWPQFVQKWQQWSSQGLRLIDLEITRYGSQTRYSGVWRRGSGGYGLWVNSDWTSFREKWQQWSDQGLRLGDLEITTTGFDIAASPTPTATARSDDSGFGMLSLDDDAAAAGDDSDDDAGFGMLSLDDDAAAAGDDTDDDAGFGMLTFDDDAPVAGDEAGFGMSSLDDGATGEDDESGFGDVSFASGSADDAATNDEAGFGMSSLDDGG